VSPADVVWLAVLFGFVARFWPKPRRAPVRKGSPVGIAPAEVDSGAFARGMRGGR
jgi:hypothetical protein